MKYFDKLTEVNINQKLNQGIVHWYVPGRAGVGERRHVPAQRGQRGGRAFALRLALTRAVLHQAQHEGVPLPAAAPHRDTRRGQHPPYYTQVSTHI